MLQGKIINGFELKHQLGEGGMAEVWYAENSIGKKAAVKVINKGLSYNEQIVERFKNEAKIMVALEHPNIRQAYDFSNIDGQPAIIQEYLEGNDMETLIHESCKISEDLLVRWWDQLVAALNYTHALGIVHRDIKPSNIFIDKYGNVKLMDFGIAKIVEDVSLTMTGTTLGTRLYMSPEQVKDPKRVGYKSDNYSLAVSYVHLLTGKAPYDTTTSSDFDVQLQIVSKPLDLSNVPENWRNFLLPYLEKDPDKRAELKPFVNNVSAAASAKPATPVSSGDETRVDEAPIKKAESKPKSTVKSTTASKPTETKKSRKGLWIGLGVGAAVMAVAIIVGVVIFSNDKDESSECYVHEYVDDNNAYNQNEESDNITSDSIVILLTDNGGKCENTEKPNDDSNINSEVDEKTQTQVHIVETIEIEEEEEVEPVAFAAVENKPEYPGGDMALMKYLAENTKYPAIAKENGVSGRVFVQFVIDKTGAVTNVKVLRGVYPALDAEAVRVVEAMPSWKPGLQRGKAVPVIYSVPINFKL